MIIKRAYIFGSNLYFMRYVLFGSDPYCRIIPWTLKLVVYANYFVRKIGFSPRNFNWKLIISVVADKARRAILTICRLSICYVLMNFVPYFIITLRICDRSVTFMTFNQFESRARRKNENSYIVILDRLGILFVFNAVKSKQSPKVTTSKW